MNNKASLIKKEIKELKDMFEQSGGILELPKGTEMYDMMESIESNATTLEEAIESVKSGLSDLQHNDL